jgi:hypothetical protein
MSSEKSAMRSILVVVIGLALALSAVISIQNAYANTAVGTLPDGRLQVFMTGSDGTVYSRWKITTDPNSPWTNWSPFGDSGKNISVAPLPDGRLQVFLTHFDGTVVTRWKQTTDPNSGWTPWQPFH